MSEQKQIIIYKTDDGQSQLDVNLQEDTVWLNRKQLADLFDRDIKTIGKHLNNVFKKGELDKGATVTKYETVQKEGDREVTRKVSFGYSTLLIPITKCRYVRTTVSI